MRGSGSVVPAARSMIVSASARRSVAPLPRRRPRRSGRPIEPAPHLPPSNIAPASSRDRRVASVPQTRASSVGRRRRGAASTVHRVGVRHGRNQIRWLDLGTYRQREGHSVGATERPVRRIGTSCCGELVHIDVKKAARVPDGGGHRKLGRAGAKKNGIRVGYTHIHAAIDAYSTSPTASSPGPRTPATPLPCSTGPSHGSPHKASRSTGS